MASINIGQAFSRKAVSLLQWLLQQDIHVCLVQECGDPIVDNNWLHKLGYHCVISGRDHLGVCIVYKQTMTPLVTDRLEIGDSDNLRGRVQGVIFTFNSCRTLLVSAYFPPDLDRCSDSSVNADIAREIYSTIDKWCSSAHRTIVGGDMNETLTSNDRENRKVGSKYGRFIAEWAEGGWIDCYRAVHPKYGFTCITPLPRGEISRSRIDYIWMYGFPLGSSPIRNASVGEMIPNLRTNHRPLLIGFDIDPQEVFFPRIKRHLPNLRKATPEHKEQMVKNMVYLTKKRILDIAQGESKEVNSNLISEALNRCALDSASRADPVRLFALLLFVV